MCIWLCTASVHNTTQNSSDNLSSYLQTNIIAQMLSTGGSITHWRNATSAAYARNSVVTTKQCTVLRSIHKLFTSANTALDFMTSLHLLWTWKIKSLHLQLINNSVNKRSEICIPISTKCGKNYYAKTGHCNKVTWPRLSQSEIRSNTDLWDMKWP